ncbi:MAG TPA: carnitine dehydratase [Bacteroidales bacterium]|nr:MAG: carnitine dehydratase [Bacteroidetes bacterium GWF2_33_38]OFY75930.1 MAG: carnitine dehydratase [Bacteroidetes bacterium RIFOXYA12_FULL_33_9]OFY86523.1 MAG: carnitine dehydratase [Bacteroidetes bacterium RIFOXYA2_FULL_33_7]HBF87999.1 carnitine dehydratase [Bacteroidales bacterium]
MKPLENIKILDLTRVLAGPFSTMILSDLGAEVVKIEVPLTGDDSRAFGPFKNNKSMYFLSINRGKKSVSINLKSEKGKKILLDLVEKFDVIIENFKPGTMEKLGLGYDVIKEINPKIIYAASSGFGHTGPDSKKPAYDILVQAMGGVMSITGWPDSPPTRVGMSLGDITASFYTGLGILAALYQRTITGLGQKIDVAMLDCQLSILENALLRFQVDGVPPKPIGNRHPTITPFQAFQAKDNYFVIGVGNDSIFVKLCHAISREDLLLDERFKTNSSRTKYLTEIVNILNNVFLTKNVDEWMTILENAQVPCAPINTIDKVMENRQLKARNMIVEVEDKVIGKVKIAGNPIKMTSIPEQTTRKPAPEIGEHNIEILSSLLNMSEHEINKLKEEGVL